MTRTQNDRSASERFGKYRRLLLLLAILIAASAFQFWRGERSVRFDWTDVDLTVSCADNQVFRISFADVIDMQLAQSPDLGHCLNGQETASWRFGTWENDAWGRYVLCAGKACADCIVLRTDGGIYALSYESDDVTAALYESLKALISPNRSAMAQITPKG